MIEGTARNLKYIAPPENMLGYAGCFFSADVYSFGVLLWELLSLDIAFENMSSSSYQVEVSIEGYRPNLRRVGAIPKGIKAMTLYVLMVSRDYNSTTIEGIRRTIGMYNPF
jgi:hypothetical protein